MNLHGKNASAADRWRLAEDLVEAALVDTVYGYPYMRRARDFLGIGPERLGASLGP